MTAPNKLASAINNAVVGFIKFYQEHSTVSNMLEDYLESTNCDFVDVVMNDGTVQREAEYNTAPKDNINDTFSASALDLKYQMFSSCKDAICEIRNLIVEEVRNAIKMELKMEILAELGQFNADNTSVSKPVIKKVNKVHSARVHPNAPTRKTYSDDIFSSEEFKLTVDDDDLPESLRNNELFKRLNTAIDRSSHTGSQYNDEDLLSLRANRMDPNAIGEQQFDYEKLRNIEFIDDENINPEYDRLFNKKFAK
jgi:hypothetical protein